MVAEEVSEIEHLPGKQNQDKTSLVREATLLPYPSNIP